MKEVHEFRLVITPFCNYRCFFCHGEGLTKEHTPLALTAEDYGFVLSAGREALGWDTTTITGGEPLISPNFRQAIDANVRITVVTNASLLAHPVEMLDGVDQVNISLHSVQQDKYASITQTTYPVREIMNTIVRTRLELPGIVIHLNVTRCGFGCTTKADGIRSLFLNPDGTLSTDCKDDIPVDVLSEIKRRDQEMFIKKVNLIFAQF